MDRQSKSEHDTVTHETLEKQRQREIGERKERYEREIKIAMQGSGNDTKSSRFRRKKSTKAADDIKEWALVNADSLKEFIKYGSNKVLDQIRIRNQASVLAREEIEKAKGKKEFDVKQIGLTLVILVVFGVMAYVVVSNFLDYKVVATDLNNERVKVGQVSGQLAACQTELAQYKPVAKGAINTAPTTNPGQGNTLEG